MSSAESDRNEELVHLLGLVKNYPFENISGASDFRANLPLDAKQFELSGANKDAVASINSTLQTKPVAMFVSHLKMGTTSIGRTWVSESPTNRNEVSMFDYKNKDIETVRQRFGGRELFVDELTTDGEDLQIVDSLLNEGRKLLIRPHLNGVETYREHLRLNRFEFAEIPLKPLANQDMQQYLANRFNVGEDDAFVKFITELSGGSLRVANEISSEFLERINDGGSLTQQDVLSVLNSSHDSLYRYFRDIADKRFKLSDELAAYLPNPGLQRLKDGPMDVIGN